MGLPGVGFIGLGNMGLPMARNLLKAGRRLVVHDLNPAVAAPLTAAGATFASSPAEVASAVTGEGGAVFTMLHSGAAVREVYTGADGLLSACKPQTLLVDCSTVEPATAREMSSAAAAHGCDFLDAPVSGGAPGAASASLTFMVGSDSDAAFAAATPFFTQMGKPPVRCGSVGAGLAVKLANNLALSLQMLATAEAFSLGKAQGVDPHVLAQVMNVSTARCWSSDTYNPVPGILEGVPAAREYEGGFATSLMLKDLRLALDAAAAVGAPTPSAEHARRLYRLSAERGFASRDFGSIYAFLEAARGEPDSISVALAEAWAEEAATAAGESFDSGAFGEEVVAAVAETTAPATATTVKIGQDGKVVAPSA